MRVLEGERGALWLASLAGVAISYVFVDLLPHLAKKQVILLQARQDSLYGFFEHHAYLLSLAGFVGFLALFLELHRRREPHDRSADHTGRLAVGALVLGGSAYVALIAYMTGELPSHRNEPIAIFTAAMAIHMIGLSHFVRAEDPARYDRSYRFALAGAAWVGWLLTVVTEIPDTTYALWFSLLAGSIIAVATTSELSIVTTRAGIARFLAGTAVFTALLLMLERSVGLD